MKEWIKVSEEKAKKRLAEEERLKQKKFANN